MIGRVRFQRIALTAGRWRRRARFAAVAVGRWRRDYLFVSGPGGDARRYRCDHQAEQLRLAGFSADVGYHDELDLLSLVDRYCTIVLYRVPWDARVEHGLGAARARGTRVLGDIDDLVFDRDAIPLIRGVTALGARAVREAEERAEGLATTLRSVDGIVVSTDALREAALRLNANVAVAYNSVSGEMLRAGEAARARAKPRMDEVVVAYLSGTPTHDRDFLEAADAVLDALDRFPRLRFLAVGFLTLDERFAGFGERVERIPYLPWCRLPSLLARVDVTVAPLERDNEFTNAKSCLKYLEAAVVAIPTIATPTSDFRRVIDHGVNGMLAADPGDWRNSLARVVESRELRRRLGDAALMDVRARHTTAAHAAALMRRAAAG